MINMDILFDWAWYNKNNYLQRFSKILQGKNKQKGGKHTNILQLLQTIKNKTT